jgi:phage tail-like protein
MKGSTAPRILKMLPAIRRLGFVVAGMVLLLTIVRSVGAPPVPAGTTVVLRDPSSGLNWSFESCRALGSEHETIEHKVVDGTGVETIRKLPGRLRFLDLECSRILSEDTSLWVWRALVERGNIEEARRDLELDLFDATMQGIDSWTVGAAWPSRLEAVLSSDAATERIHIVMENVVRSGQAPPTLTPPPTAVPTSTPTPGVPTPTPTPSPPVDPVFSDGFESGDTAEWSLAVGTP